jgi:hypothetical protein
LTLTSGTATPVIITLNGTAVANCVIAAPTATDATAITDNGFTANWNEVEDASAYELYVYTKEANGTQTQTEGFDNVVRSGETNKMDFTASTVSEGWTLNVSSEASRHIYSSANNFGLSSPSICFATTGDYIETATYNYPITALSFWLKEQPANTGTAITSTTVVSGFNGVEWVEIETVPSYVTSVSSYPGTTHTVNLSNHTNIVKIKISFTKDAGNLAIDDIVVAYGGVINSPLEDYNPKVIAATSEQITGLQPTTTYYYTVKAVGSGIYCSDALSAASNEITVTTAEEPIVSVIDATVARFIRSQGNKVMLSAVAGEVVNIYNTIGQLLTSQVATAGENHITLNYSGVVLVKVGSDVAKVIVK